MTIMVFSATQQYFSYISQFYWWKKPEYPEKTTDLPQVTIQTWSHNSVLARISKGQGATSEKGTFMRKRWLKKGTFMHKDWLEKGTSLQ
jgi:hypothetical protein